jgi:hypothetical protein
MSASVISAQVDSTASLPWDRIILNDGATVLRAGAHLATSPLRWDGSDWVRLGVTATATGAALSLDDEILSVVQKNKQSSLDNVSSVSEMLGDGRVVLLAASTAYLAGLFLHHQWTRETALLAGTAALYSTLLTRVVKPVVGRARPYVGLGSTEFNPVTFDDDYNSFPSGHTVVAFSVAAVLARRVDNTFASIGFFALATSTALSRVYTEQHWFSDVVFGGIVSTLLAQSVVDWYEGESDMGKHAGLKVTPVGNGVRIAWVF